jgi:hypothetical protein
MSKWSDDVFLNGLRALGDEAADRCAAQLVGDGNLADVFRHADRNYVIVPANLPPALKTYAASTSRLPAGVDLARVARAEDMFQVHALPVALVLLTKSLPEGYAAPNLSRILSLSGDLDHHPYRRLLGVLQMVVDVTTVRGFQTEGNAIVTAQKLRLLHAGIRHVVRQSPRMGDFEQKYGVPVNLEDMLGTIMGFSYLVIDGLRKIDFRLKPEEAEDMYYLWTVFARVMGIHPPGKPDSDEFVPQTMSEAGEFYHAYARRHYVDAEDNPDGVQLARENLQMLVDLVPRPLRWLGMAIVPRLYMQHLIGVKGCLRVGIEPLLGIDILKRFTVDAASLLLRPFDRGDSPRTPHNRWSRALFQHMIDDQYGGQVTFLMPQDLQDMRKLA